MARPEAWINSEVRPRLGLTGPPMRIWTAGVSDPARIGGAADAAIERDSAEALIARAKEVAGT